MATALINGRILGPQGMREGVAVLVAGKKIAAVVPFEQIPSDYAVHDLAGAWLVPGFIDSQVNGGGGSLFNDNPTVDAIRCIGAAHRRFGTTGFFPTLISDSLEVVARAIKAVENAIAVGVPGVLGIHIEGPFLNGDRRGIHDASHFRTLGDQHIDLLTSLAGGRTLITLAPECAEPSLIEALIARGAVIAIGHSDATYEEAADAFDRGVSGVTHLFNAMSQLRARAPGVVGAALENDSVWCSMIADGHHLAPAAMRVAARCKPPERLMLVTDAMSCVGGDDANFKLFGKTISVRDGICCSADGKLAGSNLDMASAVRNVMSVLDVSLEQASAMASANPAAFLKLDDRLGVIGLGMNASMVALDRDLNVTATWIDGSLEENDR